MVGFWHWHIPTYIITDISQQWWDFVMVGICWVTIVIIILITTRHCNHDHSHLANRSLSILTSSSGAQWVLSARILVMKKMFEINQITCEAFDVGEKNWDFLVAMDVDLVELGWNEFTCHNKYQFSNKLQIFLHTSSSLYFCILWRQPLAYIVSKENCGMWSERWSGLENHSWLKCSLRLKSKTRSVQFCSKNK